MMHYGQDGLYQAITTTTHCYPDTHSLSLSKGATYVQEFSLLLRFTVISPLVNVPNQNGQRSFSLPNVHRDTRVCFLLLLFVPSNKLRLP
jgi:hypothetical protein